MRASNRRICVPNPELAVELENFAGTGELRGIDALETTLSLSQVIELGDKRSRRVEVAHAAERDIVAAERDVRQLDVIAEVAGAFHRRRAGAGAAFACSRRGAVCRRPRSAPSRSGSRPARSPEAERSRAQIAKHPRAP
jgi:cobalt-zinc-cadmium efflux system outer membrane protein